MLMFELLNMIVDHKYLSKILNWHNTVDTINMELRIRGLNEIIDMSINNNKIKLLAMDHFDSVKNVLNKMLKKFKQFKVLIMDLHIIYAKNLKECLDILRLFFNKIVKFLIYFQESKLTTCHFKYCLWNNTKTKVHFGELEHNIDHNVFQKCRSQTAIVQTRHNISKNHDCDLNLGPCRNVRSCNVPIMVKSEMIDMLYNSVVEMIDNGMEKQQEPKTDFQQNIVFDSRL